MLKVIAIQLYLSIGDWRWGFMINLNPLSWGFGSYTGQGRFGGIATAVMCGPLIFTSEVGGA